MSARTGRGGSPAEAWSVSPIGLGRGAAEGGEPRDSAGLAGGLRFGVKPQALGADEAAGGFPGGGMR